MTTFASLVDETFRRLLPAQMDLTASLNGTLTVTGNSITLSGPMASTVSYGMRLSLGSEILYVTSFSTTTLQATVVRGFDGSTAASHASGSLVYINPKFTAFDIMGAINEELDALGNWNTLFRVKTLTITYNPVFTGYDFPATDIIDVLGIRYKIAPPTHNYPPIKSWWWAPYMTDTTYPSGKILKIDQSGWPGMPMHVWYAATFAKLTALTQTVQTVSGYPATANDILPIGAAIRLVQGREVKRNFIESQPDPRKAPEVPAGAIVNSVKGLQTQYLRRIDQARTNLWRPLRGLRVRP